MDISKDEYKLLKQFYRHDFLIIDNEISELLMSKRLIQFKSYEILRDGSLAYSKELVISNAGKIAYEKHYEEHQKIRNATITSWIA